MDHCATFWNGSRSWEMGMGNGVKQTDVLWKTVFPAINQIKHPIVGVCRKAKEWRKSCTEGHFALTCQSNSPLALLLPLSCFHHAVMTSVHVLFSSKAEDTHIHTHTCWVWRIIPTGLMSQQPASSHAFPLSVSVCRSHSLCVCLFNSHCEGYCFFTNAGVRQMQRHNHLK